MATPTVLIVEDDSAMREMLRFVLQQNNFDFVESNDATEAQNVINRNPPSLILLDWMLPGLSGIDFAKQLKRDQFTRHIPIVMLTAKGEEEDMVRGLNSGADDYITKPFSPRELIARLRAVLRRLTPHASDEAVEVDGLRLDPASHRVLIDDQPLVVGPTEFKLLHFLMTHPMRVYSRSQLLDWVWGPTAFVEERTVDVYVRRLRALLTPTGHDKLLHTVRGVGYRFSLGEP